MARRKRYITGTVTQQWPKDLIAERVFTLGANKLGVWPLDKSAERHVGRFKKPQLLEAFYHISTGGDHQVFTSWEGPKGVVKVRQGRLI